MVLGFVIDYGWIFKLLRDAAFTWKPRCLKSDLFRDLFGHLNSSCIGKSIFFNRFWVPREINFPFCSKTQWQMFLLVPITWRLHTNLYKFGEKASLHILQKENCCDLNLDESLWIVTFFLFSDSGLHLLNSFDFYFEWRDTEKQQLDRGLSSTKTIRCW